MDIKKEYTIAHDMVKYLMRRKDSNGFIFLSFIHWSQVFFKDLSTRSFIFKFNIGREWCCHENTGVDL
jgi:hypothetical protein